LSEVEKINVVLQYEIDEAIHRQGARMQLAQKRMSIDRAPYSPGAQP
jgi:hypothetical protein